MKLASRVSLFFLAALATILVANSVIVYIVARTFLYRQFDQQLQASLDTLVAAVEVEDTEVKWEPADHRLSIGLESGEEDVRWFVQDEQGRIIDRSANAPSEATITEILRSQEDQSPWRVLKRTLAAPHPKPSAENDVAEFAAVAVFAARNEQPLQIMLGWLLAALTVLPALCWLVAAVVGRRFCQQAIAPVSQMAESIGQIRAEEPKTRLPVPASGDELADLAVSFNRLLDDLFTAYERQRSFAGNAAHQLRTPLTVLLGEVEVALRRERSTDEYKRTLEVMHREIVAFRQTIETLLFLAQPATDVRPAEERVDWQTWLADYANRWKGHERSGDLRLEVAPKLQGCTSPALVAQLLDALVSNAFKYSPAGTEVWLQASRHEQQVRIEVIDRGSGIAAEDLPSVFLPFYRSQHARRSGTSGLGLGLAIASRIATVLGGSLECESAVSQGSRFVLTLPNGCPGES